MYLKDACDKMNLISKDMTDFYIWLKDTKHLIKDYLILEELIYPFIVWQRLYNEFVIWKVGIQNEVLP